MGETEEQAAWRNIRKPGCRRAEREERRDVCRGKCDTRLPQFPANPGGGERTNRDLWRMGESEEKATRRNIIFQQPGGQRVAREERRAAAEAPRKANTGGGVGGAPDDNDELGEEFRRPRQADAWERKRADVEWQGGRATDRGLSDAPHGARSPARINSGRGGGRGGGH